MQRKEEIFDIPLYDIKPLIEIQEYSFEYLVVVSIFALLLLMGLSYIVYIYFRNKNKFNIRVEHLKLLNAISLDETKTAAYSITQYGSTFKDDSQRHSKNFEVLVENLESYKYKKDVEEFDEDTKRQFERYIEMIDV